MLLGSEMNHIKFSRLYPWIICDMGSKINWMLNYGEIRKNTWNSLVMKMDPFVREHVNDGYTWVTCVVSFFRYIILNLSPNILLDSWKSFFVRLHYFKTSAALGFKLCIRVPRICREISKQISRLNNSVGNAVEACSFMRCLELSWNVWNPIPLQLPCCAISYQTLFLLFTSLYGTLWSSWAKGPKVDNSGFLIFNLDAFFLAVDHPLQWLKLSDHLQSGRVRPDSYPITLGDRIGCALKTPGPEPLALIQSTHGLCDVCPFSSLALGPADYRCPSKPLHHVSSCPGLQWKSTLDL